MTLLFVAAHESAAGTFRKLRDVRYLVAIGGKADLCRNGRNRRE